MRAHRLSPCKFDIDYLINYRVTFKKKITKVPVTHVKGGNGKQRGIKVSSIRIDLKSPNHIQICL